MKQPTDLDGGIALRGKFPGGPGRGPRRGTAGRVCSDGACTTVLSVYNTGDHCWEHTAREPYLLNVRRFRPVRTKSA